jgi:formate C-acetyltransferase
MDCQTNHSLEKFIMEVKREFSFEGRIQRLREKFLFSERSLCLDRIRLVTQSYQESDGQPMEIRRAMAFEKVIEGMTIYILDDELLVGNLACKPGYGNLYPEYGVEWILAELDRFSTRATDKFMLADEDKTELREILYWWEGKTVADRTRSLLGEEELFYKNKLVVHSLPGQAAGIGHSSVDYEKVLAVGFRGLIEEVKGRLAALDYNEAGSFAKAVFYRAVLITLNAGIDYAHRYAELAGKMAEKETDLQRKQELEKIAEVCKRVPENPARSFHEAVQSVWFVQVLWYIESIGHAHAPGRCDQYLYPFYRKDMDKGIISQEAAQELVELFWIKLNDPVIVIDEVTANLFAGFPTTQDITLGGVRREDGLDATNELSHMMLHAEMRVRLIMPELVVAIHKNTPDDFLKHACELVQLGTGKPKFIMVEAMQEMRTTDPYNYTIEEIRDLVMNGCGENSLPRCERSGIDIAWHTSLPFILELALNNGISRMSGDKVGVESGDPRQFTNFDHVMEAFTKQAEHAIKHTCIHRNAMSLAHAQVAPNPFQSTVIYNCLEKGLDFTRGGAKYSHDSGADVGLGTLGDSLAAIKKLVFDDKKITMRELIDSLDSDFDGKRGEEIRQMCLQAPKWGNDDDYVDLLTRKAGQIAVQEYGKYKNIHGGPQRTTLASVTAGVLFGAMTGATPDGRKAGEPQNEGGVSPHQGRDQNGPTAVLNSVSKLDLSSPCLGAVLNLKFSTKAVEDQRGLELLASLIRAYNNLGGYHVQFNCVDTEKLRDAQKHPEKYKDLMIRVAAYTAYFTQLRREIQEEIIIRTTHSST